MGSTLFALLSRFKKIILIAVLILIPISLIFYQKRSPVAKANASGFFVDVAAFFQNRLIKSAGSVSDAFYYYFNALDNYQELLELRLLRSNFNAQKINIEELRLENHELKKAAKLISEFKNESPISANVVARSGAPLSRLLRVDVGRSHGIERGDGVFGLKGAVGQVLVAGKYASDVLLLSDADSALDVFVKRTRARGIIRGMRQADNYLLEVEDFDRLEDIVPGDILLSAGDGALFPKGIPVAEVLQVSDNKNSMYIRAKAKSYEDLAKIERVMIFRKSQGRN